MGDLGVMKKTLAWSGVLALGCCLGACSDDGKKAECDLPCDSQGAVSCQNVEGTTFTAMCDWDEKAGCFQWSPQEFCEGKCDNGVCRSQSEGDVCNTCSEVGVRSCLGKDLVECRKMADGCLKNDVVETCPIACSGAACSACPTNCTEGEYQCSGKTLRQCVKNASTDCTEWKTIKTCGAFCKAEYGVCTEDLPSCLLKNGVTATVRQWTDGDTVWVVAKSDGTCNDYEYDSESKRWKNIRWRIRIHGIDAPECKKAQNKFYYYTCVKDTNYTDTNEPYGYESWVWADKLLPYGSDVILTCEDVDKKTGVCIYDATADDDADEDQQVYNRFLTYIGYSKNNATYDFSTELAREGLAFSNTKFSSEKRSQICSASKEAQDARKNIWSLGSTASEVLSHMGKSKSKGLKNMAKTCGMK